MRIVLLVGAAVLLFSANVMHADSGSSINLTFVGVSAVQNSDNPYPAIWLELDDLTYSGIIASGGTGYFNNIPDGFVVTAPSTLYISPNGGPDPAEPYTLSFMQYGDGVFTATSVETNLALGPDQVAYYFTGLGPSGEPEGLQLLVTDTDGAYAISAASVGFAPEPSSLLLAATGLAGGAAAIRRRYVRE